MNAKPQTKPQHTPEPWQYAPGMLYLQPGWIQVASCGMEQAIVAKTDWNPSPANAARIVACVNACAGLDPAALPALIEAAEKFQGVAYLLPADAPAVIGAYADLRAALAAVRGTG